MRLTLNNYLRGLGQALTFFLMKIVIQLSEEQEANALPLLLRHSPGMVLPRRTYILSEEAVRALRRANVKFSEVSRESFEV